MVFRAFTLACVAAFAYWLIPVPKTTQRPRLAIESFRAARAFATAKEPFALVATVRNAGDVPVAPETITAALVPLVGIDPLVTDASRKLPAIEPGAAENLRWIVEPSRADSPLAVSLTVTQPGESPAVRVIGIPHLESAPAAEGPAVSRVPAADTATLPYSLENDRIRLRVLRDVAGTCVLLVSVRTAGGWRQAGSSVPLVEAESAEPGQLPWKEQFELEDARSSRSATQAILGLRGRIGQKWQADLEFTLRAGSAVVDAELRMTAKRKVSLLGVSLIPFFAGDGSFGAAASETLDTGSSGPAVHRAVRWGEITTGVVRRTEPPWPGAISVSLPAAPGVEFTLLTNEHRAGERRIPWERGATVRVRSRLFALYPTAMVRQAVTVAPPAPLPSPIP